MPYTAASKVILDKGGYRYVYQRIDAPFVSDRDYTVRIKDVSQRLPTGKVVWKKVWSAANEKGPAPADGVVRLVVVDGFWQFEEIAENRTRVTYYVYTDPGGVLPAFIINGANKQAIPTLFEVVEEQANTARYQKTKPVPPSDTSTPVPTLSAPPTNTVPGAASTGTASSGTASSGTASTAAAPTTGTPAP
jgi:hypothetical protein